MAATPNLERYRQISPLGAGGMSTVVLAEDTLLDRRVALKRLHREDDGRGHSRLRREALIGASLSHPNLVSIFDIITTDEGDYVIVMEYVEGGTLAALLRRGKPGTERSLRILTGVAAALDAIHEQRIVHRDVKPGNILLGIDGSVKLADLGIAAVADRTRITTDGAVLGTFSYMAPEQLQGQRATPAVDIYALAAVAFECLSGKRAHTESNPVALAHAISTQPPPDLRSVWPEAPAAAAEVLTRGMCRDPNGRPRSAGELMARLKAALEPQTTARISPPAPPPPVAPAPVRRSAPAPVRQVPRAARPPRVPPPPAKRGRSRGAALALAALAAAVVAAVIILAASSGGSNTSGRTSAGKTRSGTSSHRHTGSGTSSTSSNSTAATTSSSSGASGSASSSGSSGSATAPAAASGSPVSAVESFYHLAAAHQYSSAWALADPSFRTQLGGFQSFQGGQSGDRSITFNSANVTNQSGNTATVYVRTTSVRDNGTQHCFGPVNLVRGSSGWLVDHININCA